jgi:hypothetical protein
VTDDVKRWFFQALARALHHAKPREAVLEWLEADYPLTAEDKAALADGIRRLEAEFIRKRTVHDRGRKPAQPGTDTWYFQEAVRDVREWSAALEMPQREVLDVVSVLWGVRGWFMHQGAPIQVDHSRELGPFRRRHASGQWCLSETNPLIRYRLAAEESGPWRLDVFNPKSLFEKYRGRVIKELRITFPREK